MNNNRQHFKDSGIGKAADFTAAEDAVYQAFRWYCCDPNADQRGCAPDCPRQQALDGIARGRNMLLLREE